MLYKVPELPGMHELLGVHPEVGVFHRLEGLTWGFRGSTL